MRPKFDFRSADLPVLVAGIVILTGVMAWFRVQAAEQTELVSTRITLATLQQALNQYESHFKRPPPLQGRKPALQQFLLDYQRAVYQRAFTYVNRTGQRVDQPDVLTFIRPGDAVRGTVHLPNGKSICGLVNVTDGFGRSIRYIPTQMISWRAPCFASVPPGTSRPSQWIYSR